MIQQLSFITDNKVFILIQEETLEEIREYLNEHIIESPPICGEALGVDWGYDINDDIITEVMFSDDESREKILSTLTNDEYSTMRYNFYTCSEWEDDEERQEKMINIQEYFQELVDKLLDLARNI